MNNKLGIGIITDFLLFFKALCYKAFTIILIRGHKKRD